MRHVASTAAALAVVVLLTACGSSGGTAGTLSSPAVSFSAVSFSAACRARYEAWRHGPARSAVNELIAQVHAAEAASSAADVQRIRAALKRAALAAANNAANRIPRCADPHGYWPAILSRVRSAEANTSGTSGLTAVILAILPLKDVPGLLVKLGHELRQTVHVASPFG